MGGLAGLSERYFGNAKKGVKKPSSKINKKQQKREKLNYFEIRPNGARLPPKKRKRKNKMVPNCPARRNARSD